MNMAQNATRKGEATQMAGEFFVMECLYRLGHLPALLLSNSRTVDILVLTKSGHKLSVSVKACRNDHKWPLGKSLGEPDASRLHVFLIFRRIDDLKSRPEVFVMQDSDLRERCDCWQDDTDFALWHSGKNKVEDIEAFRDRWDLFD